MATLAEILTEVHDLTSAIEKLSTLPNLDHAGRATLADLAIEGAARLLAAAAAIHGGAPITPSSRTAALRAGAIGITQE